MGMIARVMAIPFDSESGMKEFLDLLGEGNDTCSTIYYLAYGVNQSNHFLAWLIKMMLFSQFYNVFYNKRRVSVVLCFVI